MFGRATVECITVNAVMAGCWPEHLPVVIAGVEAMCDERFDLLGVSGTTDAVARTIANDGWSKGRVWQFLWEQCRKPVPDLLPGRDGGDGLPERTLASYSDASNDTTLIQKFRAPENLTLVVAGGTAGRFSRSSPAGQTVFATDISRAANGIVEDRPPRIGKLVSARAIIFALILDLDT